jgi:hypothetical protein
MVGGTMRGEVKGLWFIKTLAGYTKTRVKRTVIRFTLVGRLRLRIIFLLEQ